MNTPSFQQFTRSLAALFSVNATTLVGGILLPIAVARILGAEALGIFSSASALGLLLTTLIDWGYETRIPLVVAAHFRTDISQCLALFRRAQVLKIVLWCVVAVCLLSFALFMTKGILREEMSLYAVYGVWSLFRALGASYIAALRGMEQYSRIARLENIASLMLHGGCIAVLVVSQNLLLALLVLPCVESAKMLIAREFVVEGAWKEALRQVTQQKLSVRDMWCALREQAYFVAIQALGIVESRAGVFALMLTTASAQDMGFFGAAMRFPIALRTFAGALFTMLLPSFVSLQNDSSAHTANAQQQKTLLLQALVLGGGIAFAGSFFLFFAAEPLIFFVYGAAMLPSVELLRIVAALFFFQTLSNIFEAFLLARGQKRSVTAISSALLGVFFASVLGCFFCGIALSTPLIAYTVCGLGGMLCYFYGRKTWQIVHQK
ncbi:MAG: hypothetical protein EAZ92_08750 [Candidatus Kapaibacterium sp.]|nr:MAG: hypothetical protein EAZ92_08750 [Candidatus Kapabacteria bacterium]